MPNNTSITPEDRFDPFLPGKLESGQLSSSGDVVGAPLQVSQQQENQPSRLTYALEEGEKSGFSQKIDREKFIVSMHDKYVK